MRRLVAACLLAAAAGVGAAPAAADPQDLVPWCSGDQTPMDSNCREMAHQVFTHGSGTDPELPTGTDPGNQPVT
ncbi:hypothetical protein [Mycobacterium deserti]|uniref:Secreted protein n=1 Tax=Mycobacterium deserti TaxID=2978347 RepID=A0ABT2M5C1_9MYCO|nr:hypothetical protein [Mycobacterium deserti]MCT7657447.1 hypothetical protein [Mycobacterium deserti]